MPVPNEWTVYAALLVLGTWGVCRLLGIPFPWSGDDDYDD